MFVIHAKTHQKFNSVLYLIAKTNLNCSAVYHGRAQVVQNLNTSVLEVLTKFKLEFEFIYWDNISNFRRNNFVNTSSFRERVLTSTTLLIEMPAGKLRIQLTGS